jgi:hypothetical protein
MISTKNKIYDIRNVPSYWVFQYYINLDQILSGQNIKITSIWNTEDSVPSMCLYVDTNKKEYLFKDFSSGKSGDKITFVIEYFNIAYLQAIDKILKDYNEYIRTNGKLKFSLKPAAKWKVDNIQNRAWNKNDAKYWLQYRIGSSLLNKYNVKPIDYYILKKITDSGEQIIKIKHSYIYGYYSRSSEIYKIYQPKKKDNKFLKISDHIQGLDQLTYSKEILLIGSSLKDIMCFSSFNYDIIETIAPDSENTIIKPYIIKNLKGKYKYLIAFLDNDEPGKKAMAKYKQLYNIPGFSINLSKDFSDSVKDHGPRAVHKEFKSLLKECLNK